MWGLIRGHNNSNTCNKYFCIAFLLNYVTVYCAGVIIVHKITNHVILFCKYLGTTPCVELSLYVDFTQNK